MSTNIVIDHIAIEVMKSCTDTPYGTVCVAYFDTLCSTVRNFLRRVLNIYPYKTPAVQQLESQDMDTRKTFALQFFMRMAVGDS